MIYRQHTKILFILISFYNRYYQLQIYGQILYYHECQWPSIIPNISIKIIMWKFLLPTAHCSLAIKIHARVGKRRLLRFTYNCHLPQIYHNLNTYFLFPVCGCATTKKIVNSWMKIILVWTLSFRYQFHFFLVSARKQSKCLPKFLSLLRQF